ncbi:MULTISPECIES: aldo/keto reductase [Demequina]|uniref:aldo/keto reductase n=1 Tax=Demequina TaxID=577469 RepID=UPI0007823710|nr:MULTISPECIES: aldo/keto reductase [Demequina]
MTDTVTLQNGLAMPSIGLGVYLINDPAECQQSVETALRAGYRSVDTAVAYGNERAVGRGIVASGVAREDIFVTTKLWLKDYKYEAAKTSIDASLERLGVDAIDLMLLHQPHADFRGAWKALEEAVDAGKLRAIGVSNFGIDDMTKLLGFARIKPVVDQIEMHPYYQRPELVAYLRSQGITIESWAPLGQGKQHLLAEPLLAELARKHGKTVHQVLLRWHLQQGFVAIPKSTNPSHIAANLDVFDFELTTDDMDRFRSLDKGTPNTRIPRWLMGPLLRSFSPRQLP